jgi:hypothetical protein
MSNFQKAPKQPQASLDAWGILQFEELEDFFLWLRENASKPGPYQSAQVGDFYSWHKSESRSQVRELNAPGRPYMDIQEGVARYC